MSEQGTTKALSICVMLVALAGCRQGALSQADNRILFDSEGCAFIVQPGVGDTSFVKRIKDADRQGCKQP